MPSSYQAPHKKDTESKATFSQSTKTNTTKVEATVAHIIAHKGSTVFTVSPDDTIKQTVDNLCKNKIGAVLVCDADDRLVGVFSERDVMRVLSQSPDDIVSKSTRSVMTENVQTCQVDESLHSVISRMSKGRFRHMPVVGSEGIIGLVSIGDVVNHRLMELEHEALQIKQLIVG